MELTKEQKQILDTYVRLAQKQGRHPAIAELTKAGVTRNKARHHFGTLDDLRRAAKEYDPKAFKNIVDSTLFTKKKFQELKAEARKYKRFIVTTAVTGCSVHDGFLAAIKNYCARNNAMLLVLPSSDPAAIVNSKGFIDPKIAEEYIVFDDLQLNEKVHISSIKLSAKHIDPITGLGRIGQRNGSFIYASPKQRLKMTPTSNVKLPHAMMTTGAITKANYKTERFMSDRTAYIADNDHVLGAIVVELTSEKRYHFRQIQADRTGGFVDLGQYYSADGSKAEMRPELLVLGDWHSGETDPRARSCFVDAEGSVTAVTKPKAVVLHDAFNGMSISHHEEKNTILRAQRAMQNQISLDAEIKSLTADLNALSTKFEQIIMVKSNHDEFLDRYIADARYVKDPQNMGTALTLARAMVDGHCPLRFAVESLGLTDADKVLWLDRDEDFKVAGIECGAHGDKGSNGARGSLRAMENAYGASVSGHSHTPEILRGAWQVGTLSMLKLNYNVGPSSWMHTSCLVYANGSRQLINVIDGKWRLEDASIDTSDGADRSISKATRSKGKRNR